MVHDLTTQEGRNKYVESISKKKGMNHYESWTFEPIENGSYGHLGKLYTNHTKHG